MPGWRCLLPVHALICRWQGGSGVRRCDEPEPVGRDVTLLPMALQVLATRDEETGIAYLRLADIGPGQAVRQEIVSLDDDPDNADLVLDFNAHGQLLGIEFLKRDTYPLERDRRRSHVRSRRPVSGERCLTGLSRSSRPAPMWCPRNRGNSTGTRDRG